MVRGTGYAGSVNALKSLMYRRGGDLFPFSGHIFAGNLQFSGCVNRAAVRGMTDEEIEVHGGADSLHPTLG